MLVFDTNAKPSKHAIEQLLQELKAYNGWDRFERTLPTELGGRSSLIGSEFSPKKTIALLRCAKAGASPEDVWAYLRTISVLPLRKANRNPRRLPLVQHLDSAAKHFRLRAKNCQNTVEPTSSSSPIRTSITPTQRPTKAQSLCLPQHHASFDRSLLGHEPDQSLQSALDSLQHCFQEYVADETKLSDTKARLKKQAHDCVEILYHWEIESQQKQDMLSRRLKGSMKTRKLAELGHERRRRVCKTQQRQSIKDLMKKLKRERTKQDGIRNQIKKEHSRQVRFQDQRGLISRQLSSLVEMQHFGAIQNTEMLLPPVKIPNAAAQPDYMARGRTPVSPSLSSCASSPLLGPAQDEVVSQLAVYIPNSTSRSASSSSEKYGKDRLVACKPSVIMNSTCLPTPSRCHKLAQSPSTAAALSSPSPKDVMATREPFPNKIPGICSERADILPAVPNGEKNNSAFAPGQFTPINRPRSEQHLIQSTHMPHFGLYESPQHANSLTRLSALDNKVIFQQQYFQAPVAPMTFGINE